MKKKSENGRAAFDLRLGAEERLKRLNEPEALLLGKDPLALVHELTVHRIELEMQNEELRRAHEEAENARRHARELYDYAPVGYFTLERNLKIRELNFAAAALLGQDRSRLVGSNLLNYVTHEERPLFSQSLERVQGIQKKASFESRFIGVGESELIVQIEAAAGLPSEGYLVAVLDVTRHRELENQLRHAQKMEAIGTLTGGIAHEFNNIMTAVIGYGSLLKSNLAEDEALSPKVDALLKAADRAASLVRSLLSFSSKRGSMLIPVALNELIGQAEELLMRIKRDDINLHIRTSSIPLTVRADGIQIEQVLVNLMNNSRDAMPDGGDITITTRPVAVGSRFAKSHGFLRGGSYAVIEFEDDGCGMGEETRKRIFEPFFTTKVVGKGTGLGLSVCYSIVQQHGGYILCESEQGKGSKFTIYLPLTMTEPIREEPKYIVRPKGGSETILIADDDDCVLMVAKEILEEYGYEVVAAVDGRDALEKFHAFRDRLSLVILDVIMPLMNGRDVYAEIKRLDPEMKVILASGYAEQILAKEGNEADGIPFVAKPFVPETLLTVVRRILERE